MKNIFKISIMICMVICSQMAAAKNLDQDTLQVIKSNGELVKIILTNIEDKNEVQGFNLSKIIESIAEDKDKIENKEMLVAGKNITYRLKKSGDYYFLSQVSTKPDDIYKVQIFPYTSKEELGKIKAAAAENGIDVTYETLEIINGKIEALTLKVDCNDGYSGTASTTSMPASGIGFIRNYSAHAVAPFQMGKIFENNKKGDETDLKDDFNTAFNQAIKIKKGKESFLGYSHQIDFSIGLNNYLNSSHQFPDNDNKNFSLAPLTSWTYGIHSTHVVSTGSFLKFNFQLGLLWNNFALADDKYQIKKGEEQVELEDTSSSRPDITPKRSKLNITYLNFNFVPMIHFGIGNEAFRIGAGPFGSYRIASKSKFKYKDNGKDVNRNNFHINNWKYGLKAQIGWKGVDLFATYDLSPIFIENRGPETNYPLRAISFGIII